jgi:hypothetical protein
VLAFFILFGKEANACMYQVYVLLLIAVFVSSHEAAAEPSYAKWGRLAMNEASKRYEVVDYHHIGRKKISDTISQEAFKLWVRKNEREFAVYVTIMFENATDRLIELKLTEAET